MEKAKLDFFKSVKEQGFYKVCRSRECNETCPIHDKELPCIEYLAELAAEYIINEAEHDGK